MRLLFDQNLSHRLVAMLAAEYPRSRHVTELGLDTATDSSVSVSADERCVVGARRALSPKL